MSRLKKFINSYSNGNENDFRFVMKSKNALVQKDQWDKYNTAIQSLSASDWRFIKQKLENYAPKRNKSRGWPQLMDSLNEVRAYHLLKEGGETRISFIKTAGSPDIKSQKLVKPHITEIKTIHNSELELFAIEEELINGKGRFLNQTTDPGLKNKIEYHLTRAISQFSSYDPSYENNWRIILYISSDADAVAQSFSGENPILSIVNSFGEKVNLSNLKIECIFDPLIH